MGLGALVIEVVLPTYNGAAYLREQVESIHRQTLQPQRLLVRDDGSTDGTQELLAALQQQYGSWLVLLPADGTLGCSANVNRLLEHTRAPYVALADQDDIWLPQKLQSSFRRLQQLESRYGLETPLLVHTDLELVDSEGTRLGITYWQRQRLDPRRTTTDQLLVTNVVTGCTVLMNRPLLGRSLPIPPGALMHDWWLALVASAVGAIGCLAEPAILYRQHDRNVLGARGTSVFAMFGRLIRQGQTSPVARVSAVVAQAQLLQQWLGLPTLPLVLLSRLPRLVRCWRLLMHPELGTVSEKHGPLRTWGFRLVLCLAPPQRC